MTASRMFQRRPAARAMPTRQSRGAGSEVATGWILAGMVLVAVYVAQAFGNWSWDRLAALQQIELYKQMTGLALILLFAEQWRLSAARMDGRSKFAGRLLISHRNWGVVAPALLLMHANSFGHAYIRVLCLAFLGLISLGLLHQPIIRLNRSWLTTGWLIIHVALATMLIYLIGYHAFNSFYYE